MDYLSMGSHFDKFALGRVDNEETETGTENGNGNGKREREQKYAKKHSAILSAHRREFSEVSP